ncbi:MAG: hypothetical protein HKN17_03470 [Rhodothermales bacterium]|nr:hypothetical protein [Rhodothermales bacterium]
MIRLDPVRFRLPVVVALLGVAIALGGCREFPVESEDTTLPNSENSTIAVNTRFLLDHGNSVELGETGQTIRFENVLEDSRCPTDAVCGQIGRAGIRLIVLEESRESELVMYIPGEVATPFEENGTVFFKGLFFRLLALEPYPFPGISRPESSYRALLRIEQPQ